MSLRSTAVTHDVVVGQTAPYDLFLLADGQTPPGLLTGTVDLLLANLAGTPIDFAGDVEILDAARWEIRVNPDPGDWATPGNYQGRIRVTDDNGKLAFFPDGAADIWRVRSVY